MAAWHSSSTGQPQNDSRQNLAVVRHQHGPVQYRIASLPDILQVCEAHRPTTFAGRVRARVGCHQFSHGCPAYRSTPTSPAHKPIRHWFHISLLSINRPLRRRTLCENLRTPVNWALSSHRFRKVWTRPSFVCSTEVKRIVGTRCVVDPTDIRKLYVRNELNLKRAVEHADFEKSP